MEGGSCCSGDPSCMDLNNTMLHSILRLPLKFAASRYLKWKICFSSDDVKNVLSGDAVILLQLSIQLNCPSIDLYGTHIRGLSCCAWDKVFGDC